MLITFEFSILIFKILTQINNEALVKDLLEKAVDYARIRTDWHFMDIESKRSKNSGRTNKHDAFIKSITTIYKFMKENEQDVSWYDELPDYRSPSGRKEWGDLACYFHCYMGVINR